MSQAEWDLVKYFMVALKLESRIVDAVVAASPSLFTKCLVRRLMTDISLHPRFVDMEVTMDYRIKRSDRPLSLKIAEQVIEEWKNNGIPNSGRLSVIRSTNNLKYRVWNHSGGFRRKRLLRAVLSREGNRLAYDLDVMFATNDAGFHLDPYEHPRAGNLLNDLALRINSIFHEQTLE